MKKKAFFWSKAWVNPLWKNAIYGIVIIFFYSQKKFPFYLEHF